MHNRSCGEKRMAYREIKITFRVSEEENEHLRKMAVSPDSSGKTYKDMSEFVRGTLFERTGYQSSMIKYQLRDLLFETNKIGVNINQIAKKYNQNFGNTRDIQVVLEQQAKLCGLVEEYKETVETLWQSQN